MGMATRQAEKLGLRFAYELQATAAMIAVAKFVRRTYAAGSRLMGCMEVDFFSEVWPTFWWEEGGRRTYLTGIQFVPYIYAGPRYGPDGVAISPPPDRWPEQAPYKDAAGRTIPATRLFPDVPDHGIKVITQTEVERLWRRHREAVADIYCESVRRRYPAPSMDDEGKARLADERRYFLDESNDRIAYGYGGFTYPAVP